jgi:putative membrane protein
VAIIIIIYKLYTGLIKQLFPFLIVFLIGGTSKFGEYGYILIIIAIIGSIYGVIAFFKYFFFIDREELVIRKGVFQKKNINIPFERIQTIDFSQNLIHRVFNVVALKVDTAGSSKNEFEFDALDRGKAVALRQLILTKKAEVIREKHVGVIEEPLMLQEEREPILKLNIGRLLLVGLTENHFRSFGLIILAAYWILDSLDDIGYGWNDLEGKIDMDSILLMGIAYVIALIIFFAILSLIISLFRTVFTYFELSFYRQGKGFRLVSGLLNRREKAAVDTKIQVMQWSQNVLQKILGYYDLFLKQAATVDLNSKKSIKIPGCSIDEVNRVEQYLYKEIDLGFNYKRKVSIYYLYRRLIYITLFGSIVLGFLFYVSAWKQFAGVLILYLYLITTSILKYKKLSFELNDDMLKINGGTFGENYSLLPLYKVQNIKKVTNIYQRRKELASLKVFTASGALTIPYIPNHLADEITNYLLYRVEVSKKNWM